MGVFLFKYITVHNAVYLILTKDAYYKGQQRHYSNAFQL